MTKYLAAALPGSTSGIARTFQAALECKSDASLPAWVFLIPFAKRTRPLSGRSDFLRWPWLPPSEAATFGCQASVRLVHSNAISGLALPGFRALMLRPQTPLLGSKGKVRPNQRPMGQDQ